jgi:LysR family transcriptional regulator, cell division regulator
LPGILSSYCGKYPNVELTLRTGVTEQLLQDILDLKLDGAFVTGPIKHPLIEQVEVIREKLVIVSKESTFAPEDLTSTPLLVYNQGCGYRRRLESWMKDDGLIPKRVMEFGTFGTIIGSVAAGLGITIIPESSVASLVREGSLFSHRLPELYGEVETVFIRRKDAHLTSTVRSFVEEIEGLVSRA